MHVKESEAKDPLEIQTNPYHYQCHLCPLKFNLQQQEFDLHLKQVHPPKQLLKGLYYIIP